MRGAVQGFYLQDPAHPALKHNAEFLEGFGQRVNQERGLRAARVRLRPPASLCGAFLAHEAHGIQFHVSALSTILPWECGRFSSAL